LELLASLGGYVVLSATHPGEQGMITADRKEGRFSRALAEELERAYPAGASCGELIDAVARKTYPMQPLLWGSRIRPLFLDRYTSTLGLALDVARARSYTTYPRRVLEHLLEWQERVSIYPELAFSLGRAFLRDRDTPRAVRALEM